MTVLLAIDIGNTNTVFGLFDGERLDRFWRVKTDAVEHGARPAFKGYRGYPGSVCTSINQEVVHGIPSPSRRIERETFSRWISESSWKVISETRR